MEPGANEQPPSNAPREFAAPVRWNGPVTAYFSLERNLSSRTGCRVFAARRIDTGDPVRLTITAEPGISLPHTEKELAHIFCRTAEITSSSSLPTALFPVEQVIQADDALCGVEPMAPGNTLTEYMRRRNRLKRPVSFAEGVTIFYPIAVALDYLLQQGQQTVFLASDDIWLSDSGTAAGGAEIDLQPLHEKSDLEARFSALCIPPKADETFDPNAIASGSIGTVSGPDDLHPAPNFARLVYRVLTGRDVPRSISLSPLVYEPTTLLESRGNMLLRDILSRKRPWGNAVDLLRELCQYQAVAWPPKKVAVRLKASTNQRSLPSLRPPPLPAALTGWMKRSNGKRVAFVSAAIALLLAGGALAWRYVVAPGLERFTLTLPPTPTPRPTPAPTPEPPVVTPPPVIVEITPKPTPHRRKAVTPSKEQPAVARSTPAPPKRPSKQTPWVNSLGMEFVPIPRTQILMCRTLTRVQDFRRFAQALNYRASGGSEVLVRGSEDTGYAWVEDQNASWERPGFKQGDDHPVVCVNWQEAKAFCKWLSVKEGRQYRLPTDAEWTAAVGGGRYPWGEDWPPPPGTGNFADSESAPNMPFNWGVASSYNDGFPRTSPVKQFRDNAYGLYDMAGNAWQWCEETYRNTMNEPDMIAQFRSLTTQRLTDGTYMQFLRGSSWADQTRFKLRTSYRRNFASTTRSVVFGFRCVVQDAPDITLSMASPTVAGNTAAGASAKAATREKPYLNTLGMEFVPIPGKKFLVGRTLTRLRDFRAYVNATGYWQTGGSYVLMSEYGTWKLNAKAGWATPGFPQNEDHPVVCVNVPEAMNFCRWLSAKEGLRYRLPTDAEWTAAVGTTKYPWGDAWPPPAGSGNYAGLESRASGPSNWTFLPNYDDGFPRTSPVGRFRENPYGLFDMGGNALEWCDEEYRPEMNDPDLLQANPDFKKRDRGYYVLRGGCWADGADVLIRSGSHNLELPQNRYDTQGFRCVVEIPDSP